jgi:ribosomal protein S21
VETFNLKGKTMSKTVNVEVSLKEVGGNTSRLIKKFIKKVKKEKIVEKFKERMFFEKPSKKRRREKIKKLQNIKKAEAERRKKLKIKYT